MMGPITLCALDCTFINAVVGVDRLLLLVWVEGIGWNEQIHNLAFLLMEYMRDTD
ncbi:hypothetical protein Scep_010689 [Stephania cephalantha]|uniref:Uncharacterized protein n=1 Tax=Stephania cephalantha TaxID=152367 RepID=A0AAP0PDJ1_9MAGN